MTYNKLSQLLSALTIIFSFQSVMCAETKVKLGLNWKAEPEFGGFYAAQEDGTFKKNGLEVELLEGGAGTPTVQMLSAGTIDFGIVSGDELIIAKSQKQDLVALFACFQDAPYMIMTRKKLGFKSLADVFKSNVTLSIISGLPFASFLDKKFGFKTVKVVPYQGGLSSFLADENFAQQGFASSEPVLAEKAKIPVDTFMISDAGFNPYVVVLATREKTLTENPKLVESMVKATRQGWLTYQKSPAKAQKAIAKLNTTMDEETQKKMFKIESRLVKGKLKNLDKTIGTMTETRWNETIDQLVDLKLIKEKVPASSLFRNM